MSVCARRYYVWNSPFLHGERAQPKVLYTILPAKQRLLPRIGFLLKTRVAPYFASCLTSFQCPYDIIIVIDIFLYFFHNRSSSQIIILLFLISIQNLNILLVTNFNNRQTRTCINIDIFYLRRSKIKNIESA